MVIYILLLLTIGLAVLSLYLLWSGGAKPLNSGWHKMLCGLSLSVFIYLYGTWVYLTINAKFLFGIIALLFIIGSLFRPKKNIQRTPALWRMISNLLFTCLFTVLTILYFTGTMGSNPKKAAMAFPLKTGRYFVLQGGKGLPTNLFHYSLRGAVFAMDIVKLNSWGGRANRIFSSRLEDYEIFNDTLYSPVSGRVIRAYGDNPDNIPPNMERGPNNTNQVLLETDSFYVFLAHMKKESVIVKEGQWVKQGEALGCVGNSGFSSEPHLHIQVHAKKPGVPWYAGEPLYIQFSGKSYLLYEVIRPKRVKMVQ
ncbi:peptidoglycan DD-metalloendopeptidase family protein [Chitinophaga pendula]|uniref:peptidoglycan DD-metalloendopeptidase family protein n=1 Tax=Chitinophaga TaxID=79328 RepID=UPI000BB03197|nr:MULTISPECIES: peptidoglycan DD-metalloendopeptidase family protein [Chitinophaga]ASZ14015.1 hypothetical protein CK934_25215 [Chitinophaga sp. MD30]UCJ08357.1 peptidoglycan DD-metalloendopeptidase family protein [Chitinophaga pendula]